MNIIHGEFSFAFLNKSLTREAPTPTNISTNSDPEILKKGTPASPAIALANNVFPVPGGPTSITPFGIFAPTAVNLSGLFKKETTSSNSSLASSTPATSLNVTPVLASIWNLAFDLPKFIACPGPPGILLDLLNKKAKPPIRAIGKIKLPRIPQLEFASTFGCASISTLAFLNLVINSGAVAGNSTLILWILFPNSGPIASTIAV